MNFDNCQLEAASDVIVGVAVEPTGMKVLVKYGNSKSNRSRYIRLPHSVTNDEDNDDDAGHHIREEIDRRPCVSRWS